MVRGTRLASSGADVMSASKARRASLGADGLEKGARVQEAGIGEAVIRGSRGLSVRPPACQASVFAAGSRLQGALRLRGVWHARSRQKADCLHSDSASAGRSGPAGRCRPVLQGGRRGVRDSQGAMAGCDWPGRHSWRLVISPWTHLTPVHRSTTAQRMPHGCKTDGGTAAATAAAAATADGVRSSRRRGRRRLCAWERRRGGGGGTACS